MRDIDKLKDLLTSFGVGFKESRYTHSYNDEEFFIITLKAGYDKVDGYNWFRTEYNFDSDGTFTHIGIWE